jgi:ParB-like chromosome segregation protein Spo0J
VSNLSPKQFSMSLSRVGRLKTVHSDMRKVKDLEPHEIMEGDDPSEDATHGNYEGLKASIKKEGIKTPLQVLGNTLVEGHHRYLAAKELGINHLPMKRVK